MEKMTLLLNATYVPLKVLTWQKAIMLYFGGKVEIVESYDDFDLNSPSMTMKCPAVVRLKKYVRTNTSQVKFSRSNIFARDGYTCQYCNRAFQADRLTFDHVTPRARGGKTEWSNIVTACYPCNSKKGNRTPEEAKMIPKSRPYKPEDHPVLRVRLSSPRTPEVWETYLQV